ncbi:DUF397 domain-containing protein [Streptomyces sp. NPDC059828]|uniref:DUF397 domain-containing protein n=1 Tax=Streptomyces sp. NPDC059828 TaxID=3346965 RepID=UPI00364D2E57
MTLKPSTGDGLRLRWFKSSYSDSSNSNECVEVAWLNGGEGDCVEAASNSSRPSVHIRDSKNPRGPRLNFGSAAWSGFVAYASEAPGALRH